MIGNAGISLRAPVQRDDIYKLLRENFRGRIVIIDGIFQQVLAVGHKEILAAIEDGCQVYGLSSMGAIRAYEMRNHGMVGYGQVYQYFLEDEDFQDDEVALLHEPDPPYRTVSEPLVHFRACIADLIDRRILPAAQGRRIIAQLKDHYFGERTYQLFSDLLHTTASLDADQVIPDFEPYRLKKRDVEDFFLERAWERSPTL